MIRARDQRNRRTGTGTDECTNSPRHLRRGMRFACAALVALLVASGASAANFGVNSKDDDNDNSVGDGTCWTGGWVFIGQYGLYECTLRAAIQEANASAGLDTVSFSSLLGLNVYGTVVISVSSALPTITNPIVIDGTTIPAYDETDPDEIPIIVVDGGLLGGSTIDGLTLAETADYSVIRGLAIMRFPDHGIVVAGADSTVIEGNHIGLDRGFVVRGNGGAGIYVFSTSSETTIGKHFEPITGFTGLGNVISGNAENGISVAGPNTWIGGNKIGTDRFGNATTNGGGNHGNGYRGIQVFGSAANVQVGRAGSVFLGGRRVVSGNVIAGNTLGGVLVSGTPTQVAIRSNHIGIGADGETALGNGVGAGIRILTDGVVIGEEGIGRNVVSGNAAEGILLGDNAGGDIQNADVIGNYVGTNAAGDALVPNAAAGILLAQGDSAEIAYNVVGGNSEGIVVLGNYSSIYGNYVGTNENADDLGNLNTGIRVQGTTNQIGLAGDGNIVGFNYVGIELGQFGLEATLRANFVGTDPAGANFGNRWDGIQLRGPNNFVGGTTSDRANYVGHNAGDGIRVHPGSYNAQIVGNFIGTNASDADLGNEKDGVHIENAQNTTVGAYTGTSDTLVPSRTNRIAFNGEHGVQIANPLSSDNAIRGNAFFENGGLAIELGVDGPTANDLGDYDLGVNFLQNSPQLDPANTAYDANSGLVEARYTVDSRTVNAAYPLVVDFYRVTTNDNQAPDQWLGADSYLVTDAGLARDLSFAPAVALTGAESIVAIATDSNGNSSEIGNRVPLPEPGLALALAAALPWLAGFARRR